MAIKVHPRHRNQQEAYMAAAATHSAVMRTPHPHGHRWRPTEQDATALCIAAHTLRECATEIGIPLNWSIPATFT